MSNYAEQTAVGLLIRGCPDPEGATLSAPVLWVNRDVGSIAAPTGNLVGCNIRGRLKSADGFVQKVSLQDLLGQGTEMKFRIADKPKTSVRRDLGQLFAPDPAQIATTSWMVKTTTAYLPKGATAFDLVGPLVLANQIIWIENEAIKILAVTEVVAGYSYSVTNCTRGVLGSRDREHVLKPSDYPAGSNGKEFGFLATDRPDFDRYSFEVEVYFFTLEGNTASVAEFWPRMTKGRPTQEGSGTHWVVSTLDVLGYVQQRKVKRSPLKLSHCITIKNFATGVFVELPPTVPDGFSFGGPGNYPPGAIVAWCTPYEAERFLERRFRLPFSDTVIPTDVSNYNTRLNAYPTAAGRRVTPEIVLKCGGYDWTYRITEVQFAAGPSWNVSLGRQYIGLFATLYGFIQESGAVASVVDKPCPGYPARRQFPSGVPTVGTLGKLMEPKRNPTLNMGWSLQNQDPIRSNLGEETPEIRLRLWLEKMRPVEQIKTLLLSGQGGGQNDASYDLIVGGLGAEIDPSWLNDGTASATPITTDPRTAELLKLDQLLINVETVPLEVEKFDLGKELRRVCRVASLISSYVATGLTFRQVSSTSQASVTALKQVTGEGRLVNTGTRARPMKALSIKGGHHLITLKPGWEQPVYLFDGGDPEAGESLDVYPPGGALTPDQWFAGSVATLIRVTFLMQRGEPPTYAVPTKRQRGAIFVGEEVSWLDDSIVGPNGRGASPNRFGRWAVVGRDFNPENGDQVLTLMTDQVAEVATASGLLGAAFLITRIGLNEALNYCVQIQALTAGKEDTLLDPLDALRSCSDNGGYVRLLCPELHNLASGDQFTRDGALEVYARILTLTNYDDFGPDAYAVLELVIDPAWISYADPLTMTEHRSYLMMTDYRPKEGNPENAEIVPSDAIGQRQIIIAPGDGNIQTSKPLSGSLFTFDA